MIPYREQVEACVDYLKRRVAHTPLTVIQLGTGLSDFARFIHQDCCIPYADLPHFPRSTVESHRGNLIFGQLNGCDVAVLQGRFHFYEGYSTKEVTFPIRVLSLLGAKNLIVTNASGGLNSRFQPGTIMVMRDHLNFLGENPLRGINVDTWGPRFPDLSVPYYPAYIQAALQSAETIEMANIATGTYVCIPGPSLETPAETRWLKNCGADAVGMSSVPEVIVAIHGGMKVLGLSVVSNVNDPDNFQPILLEDIIQAAEQTTPKLEKLITEILQNME